MTTLIFTFFILMTFEVFPMSLVTFLTRNTNAGQLAPRCMVAEGNAAQFREGQ